MSKVISSIKWTMFSSLIRRFILIAYVIFKARFFSQEAIGIFETFARVISIFMVFGLFSFENYYLSKKKEKYDNFENLLQIGIFTGILLTCVLIFSSSFFAEKYSSPELGKYLIWFSPILLLEILRAIMRVDYRKKFLFKKFAFYEFANVIFYASILIAMAFINNSAWVLIVVFYLGNILELILFIKNDYKRYFHIILNSLKFSYFVRSLKKIKNEKKFFTFTTLTHLLGNFSDSIPIFVLGYIFNPALVGIYGIANQIITQPVTIICSSVHQVFFPALAEMKPAKIRDRIDKFVFVTTSLIWLGLIVYSFALYKFIPLILGEKWSTAVPFAVFLTIPVASTLLIRPISSIPIIFNKTDYEFYWGIFSLIIRIIGILIGASISKQFAILGFSIATFISHLILYTIILIVIKAPMLRSIFRLITYSIPTIILVIITFLLKDYSLITSFGFIFGSIILLIGYINYFSEGRLLKISKNVVYSR